MIKNEQTSLVIPVRRADFALRFQPPFERARRLRPTTLLRKTEEIHYKNDDGTWVEYKRGELPVNFFYNRLNMQKGVEDGSLIFPPAN